MGAPDGRADADDPRRTGDHPGGVPAFPVGVRRRLCCGDEARLWIRTPSLRPRLRLVGPRKSLVPGAQNRERWLNPECQQGRDHQSQNCESSAHLSSSRVRRIESASLAAI